MPPDRVMFRIVPGKVLSWGLSYAGRAHQGWTLYHS